MVKGEGRVSHVGQVSGIDYLGKFVETAYEVISETCDEHGIGYLYDDELTSIVNEMVDECYWQCVSAIAPLAGDTLPSRYAAHPQKRFSRPNMCN